MTVFISHRFTGEDLEILSKILGKIKEIIELKKTKNILFII